MTIGLTLMAGRRAILSALAAACALAWALLGGTPVQAMSLTSANFVDLLEQSNAIVVGKVDKVADGFDERGIPYTEITLQVSETIRGEIAGTYTFRQFGLLKPRLSPDGSRKLMPSPPGFPRYAQGEDLVLFLRPSAAWTGFRMPAGVTQGKFTIAAGRVENGMGNAGLFRNVHLDQSLVTERDRRLLATASGPLNPDAFLSFVRRAVHDRWVETERMTRTDRGEGPRNPPRSDVGDENRQTPAAQPDAPNSKTPLRDPNEGIDLPRSGR